MAAVNLNCWLNTFTPRTTNPHNSPRAPRRSRKFLAFRTRFTLRTLKRTNRDARKYVQVHLKWVACVCRWQHATSPAIYETCSPWISVPRRRYSFMSFRRRRINFVLVEGTFGGVVNCLYFRFKRLCVWKRICRADPVPISVCSARWSR